jgi:predicted anti-sigma-YlaC factor YlaD
MSDCQSIGELLSGYIDGELTQVSRQRVEVHIDSCAKCQQAYQDLLRLQQGVGKMYFDELSQSEWSTIMNDLTVKSSRGTGWLLLVVGIVIVVGYGAYEFAVDDTMPALIKSAIAAVLLGIVLLFVSVLRQRMITRKTDRYKDVEI